MNIIKNIVITCFLLFILAFVLVYFGYITCCDVPVPGFCDIYYEITHKNKEILILYGDSGIGDPEKLKNLIIDKLGKFPRMMNISMINNVNQLNSYGIIFVERAKNVSNLQLKVLKDYVLNGGKLVLIGDVGTGLSDQDYYCFDITMTCEGKPKFYGNGTINNNLPPIKKTIKLSYPFDDIGMVCLKDLSKLNETLKYLNKTTLQEVKKELEDPKCSIDKRQLYGFDLWRRSLSIDELGNRIPGIDFGREVVLADYIKTVHNASAYIIPVSKNRLTCGYTVDEIPFNGSFSLVTNEPYAGLNSVVAMNLKYNGKYYPAVIYSNPVGYTLTTGNVVYIAFPIEEFPSRNFIKNLYNFLICGG